MGSRASLGYARSQAGNLFHLAGIPLRRQRYLRGRRLPLLSRGALGRKLGLTDTSAVGSRRIEIGCGPIPRDGYIHIDIDRGARHLEYLRPAWDLPFPDGWADEISAIHSLEHVPPPQLGATLGEWRRVLAPAGKVHVSVPNGPALMQKFMSGSIREKWLMSGGLLGMYCGPEADVPMDLQARSDHQVLFDFPLLRSVLEEAGFVDVADQTASATDRHTEGWKDVVDLYSLIVTARKPGSPGER